MMLAMVKEADLDRIEVPRDYEVLDATALGRRLGFKRATVLAYLSRRNFGRILLLTASLLWALSGSRTASKSGKQRRIRRVESSRRRNGEGRHDMKREHHQMLTRAEWEQSTSRRPVLRRIPASPTKSSIQLLL
jgi:hypothetical protein